MTFVDPFAPADSPQHPANFRPAPRGHEQAVPVTRDAMEPWLVLEDEPVAQDNPDAAIIGQTRWEEYRRLLGEYGSVEQQDRMNVRSPLEEDEDMPTLAELRQRHAVAVAALEGVTSEVKTSDTPKAASDLEAKLAALKDAGL